ncbi:MAG: GSCFA domain-containing protein [Myxococcales bacterium]|nr:GSCFA domain-containing protein [Myxococcales bacterium]
MSQSADDKPEAVRPSRSESVSGTHPCIISLGFSCHTRFGINAVVGERHLPEETNHGPRFPFDWLVTTRDGLLNTLRQNGRPLWAPADELSVYYQRLIPSSGVEGDGLLFWHDYPRDADRLLLSSWHESVKEVADKYRFLWARMMAVLRDPDVDKVLVISNTQSDLAGFIPDGSTFELAFGLSNAFVKSLVETLHDLGAVRFRLHLMCHSLSEKLELLSLPALDGAGVRHCFFGSQLTDPRELATQAVFRPLLGEPMDLELSTLVGMYDGDSKAVIPGDAGQVLVCQRQGDEWEPWGAISAAQSCYYAVFETASVSKAMAATWREDGLAFDDGSLWARSSASISDDRLCELSAARQPIAISQDSTHRIDLESTICSAELLAQGRANNWSQARIARLQPEAWPQIRASFQVSPGAAIFTIGSCFARNIEDHLSHLGHRIPTLEYRAPSTEIGAGRPSRPFSKYTPADIFQELGWAAAIYERDGHPTEADSRLFAYPDADGNLRDLALAGARATVPPERFYERRRDIYRIWEQVFHAECVVITLGLIEAWFDRKTGCALIAPPFFEQDATRLDRFEFRSLDYDECLTLTQASVDLIRRHNPQAKFLITTSPVPLEMSFSGDDILIANTLSKATLRAVCGALVSDNDDLDYFPSYENVTLTRTGEVWDADLHQVSPGFVGKIVSHLTQTYFGGAAPAHLHTQKAFAALDDGDAPGALEWARAACDADANNSDAWLALSEASRRLELKQDAAHAAKQAVMLAPHNTEAHRHWIEALLALERIEEAAEAAAVLIGLDADNPRNLWLHGRTRECVGDLQGAEASHRRAFELQPETPDYSFALLSILRRNGRVDEALDLHRWVVGRFPDFLWQRLDLSRSLVAAGRIEEARDLLEAGLVLSSDEAHRRQLGDALDALARPAWSAPNIRSTLS